MPVPSQGKNSGDMTLNLSVDSHCVSLKFDSCVSLKFDSSSGFSEQLEFDMYLHRQ